MNKKRMSGLALIIELALMACAMIMVAAAIDWASITAALNASMLKIATNFGNVTSACPVGSTSTCTLTTSCSSGTCTSTNTCTCS